MKREHNAVKETWNVFASLLLPVTTDASTHSLKLPSLSSVATLKKYFCPSWSLFISILWKPLMTRQPVIFIEEPHITLKLAGPSGPFGHSQLRITEFGFTDRNVISPGGGTTVKHKTAQKLFLSHSYIHKPIIISPVNEHYHIKHFLMLHTHFHPRGACFLSYWN